MSISDTMKELKEIDDELKKMSISIKQLRKRKSELEDDVMEYLESENKQGIRYYDIIVLKTKTPAKVRKSKKEKEFTCMKH